MFVSIYPVYRAVRDMIAYITKKENCLIYESNVSEILDEEFSVDTIQQYFTKNFWAYTKASLSHLIITCTDEKAQTSYSLNLFGCVTPKLDFWTECVKNVTSELGVSELPRVSSLHRDTEHDHSHSLIAKFDYQFLLDSKLDRDNFNFRSRRVKEKDEYYKRNKRKLKKLFKSVSRKVEDIMDLERDSLNINFSRSFYVLPQYSYKEAIKAGIIKALEDSTSLNEFYSIKLVESINKEIKALVQNLNSENKRSKIIKAYEKFGVELIKDTSNYKKEKLLIKIGDITMNFNKLLRELNPENLNDYFKNKIKNTSDNFDNEDNSNRDKREIQTLVALNYLKKASIQININFENDNSDSQTKPKFSVDYSNIDKADQNLFDEKVRFFLELIRIEREEREFQKRKKYDLNEDNYVNQIKKEQKINNYNYESYTIDDEYEIKRKNNLGY